MSHLNWRACASGDVTTQECECPYCNLHIAGKIRFVIMEGASRIYYVLECPVCEKPIIYQYSGHKTYPSTKPLKAVKHLPERIEKIYDEVNSAIGAGCFTAAVTLARTAINHIAVDNGAEENKSFQHYVQYLVDNHFVPPNARGWVDKIRTMANETVHDLEIWGYHEAVTIGQFLMYLLVFIYELPSSVQ